MVEIEAWWLSPQNTCPLCLRYLRRPGLSASWPQQGQGSPRGPKKPRCWAAEHLQTLECARASCLLPPDPQPQGGELKAWGL